VFRGREIDELRRNVSRQAHIATDVLQMKTAIRYTAVYVREEPVVVWTMVRMNFSNFLSKLNSASP